MRYNWNFFRFSDSYWTGDLRLARIPLSFGIPLLIIILLLFGSSLIYAQSPPPPEMKMSATPNPVGSGARALGMGGAFISVADDATAASWNPAGLANLKRPEISAVGSFFSRQEHYDTSGITGNIDDQFSGQFRLNYLSAAIPFECLSRAMIFSLNYQHLYEFSEERSLQWLETSDSGLIDLEKTAYIKQKGSLGPISPAFAVKVHPSFYLGITVNFWIRDLLNNYWENIKTVRDKGFFGREIKSFAETYERYDFSGCKSNLHFGFLWHVTDSFRLGGVLKTPFRLSINYTFRYTSLEEYMDDPADYTYIPPFSQNATFRLKMPMSYGLGATLGFFNNYLLVSLDIYHTEWDKFLIYTPSINYNPFNVQLEPEARVKPTTQIRLGAEYLLVKNRRVLPLRAGLFYDPEPAKGRVDDFYGVSIGTGIVFKDFTFDIAYQHRFGEKREAEYMLERSISSKVREHYIYSSVIVYF